MKHIVAALLLTVILGLPACRPPPKTPAELLIGTWAVTSPDSRQTLTFTANGRFRWHIAPTTFTGRLFVGDLALPGRWQLDGHHLALAVDAGQSLPAGITLWGLRSEDMAGVSELLRVDETNLVLQEAGNTDPTQRVHYQRVSPPR